MTHQLSDSRPGYRWLVRVRTLGGLTAAVGAASLLLPHALASRLSGRESTPPDAIVRVLAGRQFAQGAALLASPTPGVLRAAVGVDTLHGLSMLVVPLVWPNHRRAALVSAAMAAVSAAAGSVILVADNRGSSDSRTGRP